jgi:glycosyltransferase involved in cell wall biosynthesis
MMNVKSKLLVSILTPTYNRRFFIPQYLKNIYRQNYLGDIEIIVADDGTEPIEDLLVKDGRIRYFKFDDKKTLGFKRNFLAEQAKGQILINFDDDDYYPPNRISHAVQALTKSDKLIAGASQIYIYNAFSNQISVSGPFGPNHATAGTFAFKREYLDQCSFDAEKPAQEEPSFTNGFSSPMVQLNPKETILVMQHQFNTWDKTNTSQTSSGLKLKDFMRDPNDIRFYKKLGSTS